VSLTADAERDLEEMYDHIAAHDSPAKADYVLDRVEEVVESLSTFPERGSIFLIADGRRDIQTLLARRLFGM
ncbi:MAG: type II toxin-antitoxin system RelE/ParE family toxin, partial [Gammaproteobacteria bacterium]